MKKVTQIIDVYQFSELSETAKQNAKNNFEYEDFWHSERMQSYKAAKDIYNNFYNIELSGERLYVWIQNNIINEFLAHKKYTIEKETKRKNSYFSHSYKRYDSEKSRFSKIITEIEFCITGYCDDYDFFAPIIDFCKKPDKNTTSDDLYNTDIDSIFQTISEREYDFFYKDDIFSEMCEANEYNFDVNGKMINL